MHSAVDIGQIFLNKARDNNKSFTPMQLLKLVYIAHGWMLGLHEKSLVEEDVEVWPYGPVIRELYDEIKHYRNNYITQDIAVGITEDGLGLSEEEKVMIGQTYDIYSKYTGFDLSNITHEKDTPWSICNDAGASVIPVDVIARYYKDLYEERSR